MKTKKVSKKIAGALATLIVALLAAYFEGGPTSSKANNSADRTPTGPIVYTRHAECRMKCRLISPEEVKDVLKNGSVNHRKSDPSAKPCPVVAKEKRTADGQKARVVYGDCSQNSKIITVIDLGKKYDCYCK